MRGRLTLALVAMAALPALLIGALAYQNATATIEDRIGSQLNSVSDLKQAEIQSWIALVQSDANLLADNFLNEEHITFILDPHTDAEQKAAFGNFLTENLYSLQASRVGYVEVYYMDLFGRIILSTDAGRVGQMAEEAIVAGAFGSEAGRFLMDIYQHEDRLEMAFSQVMRRVDLEDMEVTGSINAAVVIRVDVAPNLYSFLFNWPERGETGESYLVKEVGGEYIHLSPLRFSDIPPLSEPLPPHLQNGKVFELPMSPEDQVGAITDYRGEEVLHINRFIEGPDWILVVEQDTKEAFSSVALLTNVWILATAIILLAAFGVAAWLAKGLTNPLEVLADATRRVGKGDLQTRVAMQRADEFGELAGAFNSMVDSLRDNSLSIQQRSEELQALVNLSDTFLGSGDLGVALESALHETLAATHGEAALAMLLDEEKGILTTEAEVGLTTDLVGVKYKVDRLTAGGFSISQRRTVISPDLDTETRFRSAPRVRSLGVQSLMAVPLLIGLRAVGVLVFYGFKPYEFQADEINLAQAIANQTAVAVERIKLIEDLSVSYDRTLSALVAALDKRDKETEGHSKRVVAYTLALAKAMGLPEEQLQEIARGALLHDIGKIGVPDGILHKPGKLTEEEWLVIRKHPEWGKQILEGISFLDGPAEMVFSHHERWDGGGYPLGIQGEEIPIGARLFAVADTFDAITSNRPYRKAAPYATARQEIQKGSGNQFDPTVVDIFVEFSERDWLQVLEEYAARDLPSGLRRGTGELDPRQVALADQVQALDRIVEAITSSLNISEVFDNVLDALVDETAAVGAGIFTYDEAKGQLRYAADIDLPEDLKSGLDELPLEDLFDKAVILGGKSRFCTDLRDDETMQAFGVAKKRPQWQGFSCVALEGSDRNLGLLMVFSKKQKPFSWDNHALFERVGRLLGQAVMNARMHERVRRQAITDGLTGAYNRHYLDDFLVIETKRCSRYQRPMSLLLLDMDHFKGCNDRGGHQAGDQALREVVRILNSGLRTMDMVARYGGEEFVMVLPETGPEGAEEAAERLRRSIENHKFPCGKLSASIGVVSSDYLDGEHPDADELFARADKALFMAKQKGRNRVEVWAGE